MYLNRSKNRGLVLNLESPTESAMNILKRSTIKEKTIPIKNVKNKDSIAFIIFTLFLENHVIL